MRAQLVAFPVDDPPVAADDYDRDVCDGGGDDDDDCDDDAVVLLAFHQFPVVVPPPRPDHFDHQWSVLSVEPLLEPFVYASQLQDDD